MNKYRQPKVWGVFVGERGSQLAAFNTEYGPFPPKPNTDGYVAIGWAGIGDMLTYKNRYNAFRENFSIAYPDDNERVLSTQANMVWNFSYEILDGDYVVSPSSESGVLLVGQFTGEYLSDFNNHSTVAPSKTRKDLLHLRKVRWLAAIQDDDNRYGELNRIGQLTVSSLNITPERLVEIITNGEQ